MALRSESYIISAAFSADGSRVVTASSHAARVWEVESGEELAALSGHDRGVNSAFFSPNGAKVIAASDDATARIWDVESGQELIALRGHDWDVNSAVFSPDGETVVTASDDGTARVWEVADGSELAVLKQQRGIKSACFSPGSQDNDSIFARADLVGTRYCPGTRPGRARNDYEVSHAERA